MMNFLYSSYDLLYAHATLNYFRISGCNYDVFRNIRGSIKKLDLSLIAQYSGDILYLATD